MPEKKIKRKIPFLQISGEKIFKALINNMADVVYVLNLKSGNFSYISPSVKEILGYTVEEAKKLHLGDLLTPESNRLQSEMMKRDMQMAHNKKTKSRKMELEVFHKNGSKLWVEMHAKFIIDDKRNPVAILGVARDISEKKIFEEKIKMSEEKFREIFDYSPIAIELYNSKGELEKINKAGIKLFGIREAEKVKGFNLFDDPNIPDDKKKELKEGKTISYESAFDFGKVKKYNLYKSSKQGLIYLYITIASLRSGMGGYLIIIEDITDKKNFQVETQKKLKELEKINKLMVGRELKMLELKEKIEKLKIKK